MSGAGRRSRPASPATSPALSGGPAPAGRTAAPAPWVGSSWALGHLNPGPTIGLQLMRGIVRPSRTLADQTQRPRSIHPAVPPPASLADLSTLGSSGAGGVLPNQRLEEAVDQGVVTAPKG